MTIWGLIDDRAGHTGQVLGVIGRLGVPYVLKRLEYAAPAALPNILLGTSLLYLKPQCRPMIRAPWPTLVIASGRRTLPALRHIKRHSPKTVAVFCGWPDSPSGIDLIAAPQHDTPPALPNVMTTLAPLHAVTSEALAAARAALIPNIHHLPRPWVALCLGGKTKKGDYKASDWHELIRMAQQLAGSGSLLITTSRRTPPEAMTLFSSLVSAPHLLHRWDTDKDNPYLGLLGAADAIIVTGDSLSMCAEACAAHKPLYIFSLPRVCPRKHLAVHAALFQRNVAQPLSGSADLAWKPDTVPDDVEQVANEIRHRFPHALKG